MGFFPQARRPALASTVWTPAGLRKKGGFKLAGSILVTLSVLKKSGQYQFLTQATRQQWMIRVFLLTETRLAA